MDESGRHLGANFDETLVMMTMMSILQLQHRVLQNMILGSKTSFFEDVWLRVECSVERTDQHSVCLTLWKRYLR
jgi:hypothetical protein